MEQFTNSEFLNTALLKSGIQNLFLEEYSTPKIKQALQYSGSKRDALNVCYGSIQGNIFKRKNFIAFSFLNESSDIDPEDIKTITKSTPGFNLCYKDTETLQVSRLRINNMETYSPKHLGFANSRANCAERKVLSKILREYKELRKSEDEVLGGVLYLYTKMEPCAYCLMAIKQFTEITGTRIVLLYEELIFELLRDYITSKNRKTIIKLHAVHPTSYKALVQYDPEFAEQFKEFIKQTKKIDIETGRYTDKDEEVRHHYYY